MNEWQADGAVVKDSADGRVVGIFVNAFEANLTAMMQRQFLRRFQMPAVGQTWQTPAYVEEENREVLTIAEAHGDRFSCVEGDRFVTRTTEQLNLHYELVP